MNAKNLSFVLLISSSVAFSMQQGGDPAALLQQKKAELTQLVTRGNSTLQEIAQAGQFTENHAAQLTQITTDIGTGTGIIEDLISKIKATEAKNVNDPKALKIMEDIGGDALDVLEETPSLFSLILPIIQQAEAAQQQNHPASRFHASVAALKTKVAPAKK